MFPNPINESLKILCFGYRSWSNNIYLGLANDLDLSKHSFILVNDPKLVNQEFIDSVKPNLILFYGWSELVNSKIVRNNCCLMLHPSSLPKYRGGSPIQNQIIDGLKVSEVCIFKMEHNIDSGEILKRASLDLNGDIKEIFKRIEIIGISLTKNILLKGFSSEKQIGEPTYCKRRRPEDSEITLEEIQNSSSVYLYNKIRMLTDPYPNAFIKCADGKKLYIKKAEI